MIVPFKEEQEHAAAIVMWDGLLSDIPSGWVLCDGQNGTPDLTNRFIKGVDKASSTPGFDSGVDSNSLSEEQIPSHNHTGSAQTGGSHTHEMGIENADGRYNYSDNADNLNIYDNPDEPTNPREFSTTNSGYHNHGLSIQNSGGGSNYDNRPEFYEVAFIMKL